MYLGRERNNYTDMETIIEKYGLSGVEVLNLITDWHGTGIISDEFLENLSDCEGYNAD